jgi:hypothetical protein
LRKNKSLNLLSDTIRGNKNTHIFLSFENTTRIDNRVYYWLSRNLIFFKFLKIYSELMELKGEGHHKYWMNARNSFSKGFAIRQKMNDKE